MQEVFIARAASNAVTVYVNAWERRYGSKPFLDSPDIQIISDIVRKLGEEKTRAALEHYLSMNLPYFVERCHPVAALKTGLNQVIASMGSKAQTSRNPAVAKVRFKQMCMSCPADDVRYADLECYPDEIEEAAQNSKCEWCCDPSKVRPPKEKPKYKNNLGL